jgi:quinoprotein glucose dehydrogenase
MLYVFNRLTGEPLYPIEERAVPASHLKGEVAWPTQPFSSLPPLTPLSFTAADLQLLKAADRRYCAQMMQGLDNRGLFTPPSAEGSVVYPGQIGGANWGSSAFDPETSILYTRVSSLAFLVKQIAKPVGSEPWVSVKELWMEEAPAWLGGYPTLQSQLNTPDSGGEQRDESRQEQTPYRLARQALMTPSEVPCAPTPFGSIVAVNLDTGKKLWSVPHGEMVKGEPGSVGVGGVIVTAGGLLFAASTNDAYLRAYDSKTGKELWRGALPAAANATPMTYSVHGRQFVVIVAGGHGFMGRGKSDAVIAFALPEQR